VSTNKSYIDLAGDKVNYYNQEKVVPLYIKHIMPVSDTVYTIERVLDVGKASPVARFCSRKPFFQSHFRQRVVLIIVCQLLPRNNMHSFLLVYSITKLGIIFQNNKETVV
jgi:hypothetical protein